MISKPNFFIVGAAKAGTTSLYHCLNQHPEIYMCPIKEPHFFSRDIRCKNFTKKACKRACFNVSKYLESGQLEEKHIAFVENYSDYISLFREAHNKIRIGEASTGYLYSMVAASEIYHYDRHSKIIMILRDPVDRAYSHWKMSLNSVHIDRNISFLRSVEDDFALKEKGYCQSDLYIEMGLYYAQVKRYLDLFPEENLKIITTDDFQRRREKVLGEIFDFLEVKKHVVDCVSEHNVSHVLKYPWLVELWRELGVSNKIPACFKEKLRLFFVDKNISTSSIEDERVMFEKYFREDVGKLEDLLRMDLSSWRR